MKQIILTLTEEQAELVSSACELYTRLRVGQFSEILRYTLEKQSFDDGWCIRKAGASDALLQARTFIYPELHGEGHSFGLGKFEDADAVYDVHQVLRHALGGKEPWGMGVLPPVSVVETE